MSTRPPWPNKHTQYAVTTQCPNWSDCNIYLALKFIQNPVLLCEKSHINKKVNTLHHCLHNSHWHQFSKALGSRSQWIQCSTKITMMSYELRFYIPTQHKIGHYGNVPQANLSAWYGKTKPNTTKASIHQPKEMYYIQHKINTNKRSAVAETGDPLATIKMCPFFGGGGGAGSPSNTMLSGPRPSSVPSGILIHPALGHTRHGPKIGTGLCPSGGVL